MDFKNERLMMSEEEVRNRSKELLNEDQVDLITKYIFLEQQCKKQREVINKATNWTIKYQTEWCQEDEVIKDLKQLLDILNEVSK